MNYESLMKYSMMKKIVYIMTNGTFLKLHFQCLHFSSGELSQWLFVFAANEYRSALYQPYHLYPSHKKLK